MSYITPNDSILRSSNLQTSIRTLNSAQRYSAGHAPLPIAQQKTYAPPFVDASNEFSAKHVGRFYYVFQMIGVERVAAVLVAFSLLLNLSVGAIVLADDLCMSNAIFGYRSLYMLALLIPVVAHYYGLQGIRQRKVFFLAVFLMYSALQILIALVINIYIVFQHFIGLQCKMHLTLIASLNGALAFFQLMVAYFVFENAIYIRQHIEAKKQRDTATKLNTLRNSRRFTMSSVSEEVTTTTAQSKDYNVEPLSDNIQDTLQQVINTWEYQRDRRRKTKGPITVKFDEEESILIEGVGNKDGTVKRSTILKNS